MEKYQLQSRKPRLTAVGIRWSDHATPPTRKSLALTSSTSGGRSVGIVRLRTMATEKTHNTYYHICILHNLYSSPNIIRMIQSRRLRLVGHIARMTENKNAYRIFVGKP
jgi:hypothetical protein